MKKPNHQGKRYVNLLRCSTFDQDTSVGDQRVVNNSFAREHGMIHVFDKESEGVSGSKTFNRKDLNELITKKKSGVAFDAVLVHDLSRLTRGGIGHGLEIKRRLARVGVEVISVGDNLAEGDEKELLESIAHYKNRLFAKHLSKSTSRGLYSSLRKGHRPYSAHTPYGFDRLYLAADGTPTLLMRSIGSGQRQKLDPKTLEIRETIVKDESGQSSHFIKQKEETSHLVLGAADRVETVRWIFHQRYMLGWGYLRIAGELNRRKMAAPSGTLWTGTTVKRMLTNPIYLGCQIACQTAKGVYHKMAEEQPTQVEINQEKMEEEERTTIPATRRPKSEWVFVESDPKHPFPQLILDLEVVRRAWEVINVEWEHWNNKSAPPKPAHDRHHASGYFLKRLLRSKQDNLPMFGRTTGGTRYKIRYYIVSRGHNAPVDNSPLRRHVPADPIEKKVRDLLGQVLEETNDLGSLIEAHVREQMRAGFSNDEEQNRLKALEAKLLKRLKMIYENEDANEAMLKDTVLKIKTKLAETRDSLTALACVSGPVLFDPKDIRNAVLSQLVNIREKLPTIPLDELQRLLSILCKKLTVDMGTRDFEMEVALPSWAMKKADAITEALCLGPPLSLRALHEAQDTNRLILAKFRCISEQVNQKQPLCYNCRRVGRGLTGEHQSTAA